VILRVQALMPDSNSDYNSLLRPGRCSHMGQSDMDDQELARLLQEMQTMARDLVQQAGGCPPFGGTIDDGGQVGLIFDQTAVSGGAGAEAAKRVLETVRHAAQAANIRAAAVGGMAYVTDPETNLRTTATVISLHHRTGRNVDYVTPFSKAASGAIYFGKPITGLSKTKLF